MALKPIKEVTCLVLGYGNEVAFAQRMARDCKKVYYNTFWQAAFPKWNSFAVGMDVPDINRVDHWAEVIDEVDLVCIVDIYQGPLADLFVTKFGKAVFAPRMGESMEINRDEFMEMLEELRLPVPGYKVLNGFNNLETFLDKEKDKWIKTSVIRGNGETFHFIDKKLSASRLTELKHSLGAFADLATFVAVDPIDPAIEVGYDGFVIDGKYPSIALTGIEDKDAGYMGKIVRYDELPDVLKDINKKLSGIFAGAGYKCFFSNEVRWTGKKGYFIDPTTRAPQPPGDLQMEIYSNFPQAVWEMANGMVPELKPVAKFGAQVIIKSDWAQTESQAIYFPSKYKDRVKIKNLMYKDGVPHFIPVGVEMAEIGSCIGLGDTMKDAMEDANKIAETVKGDCVTCNCGTLDKIFDKIKRLKELGINTF